MYNVKGPSKIVAKSTRRGISQNVDNIREYSRNKSVEHEIHDTSVPKPVFHNKRSNIPHQNNHIRQEVISPQHEEIIKFIHESWNTVYSEVESDPDQSVSSTRSDQSVYYEDEPCLLLDDFKPFDLESWWGKRMYACITGSAMAMSYR